MNTDIDRRRLVQLLAAFGASAAVSPPATFGSSADCRTTLFGELDLSSIRELGREYLAQRPGAAALDDIAKLLAGSRNDAETLAQLRTKVLADFAAGRIVNLAGWFCSETEGCLFAALSRCDL